MRQQFKEKMDGEFFMVKNRVEDLRSHDVVDNRRAWALCLRKIVKFVFTFTTG